MMEFPFPLSDAERLLVFVTAIVPGGNSFPGQSGSIPAPSVNEVLQEDGFFILQEDGSRILLEA